MKWLTSKQYVYQILNRETDARYIGSSEVGPFARWAAVVSDLRNKRGTARLQAHWETYSSLIFWEFTILVEITPKVSTRELRAREAEFVAEIPEHLRLNMPHRTTVARDKYNQVVQLLQKGVRYVDIRDTVGISMGMISKIKQSTQTP